MFAALGRGVTKHPLVVCIVWLIVALTAVSATFTGWGGQGLFDRLSNSSSMVPNTESDKVNKLLTDTKSSGGNVTIVVDGVDLKTQAPELAAFMQDHRKALTDIPHIKAEQDPFVFPQTDPRAQAFMADDAKGFAIVLTLDGGMDEKAKTDAHKVISSSIDDFAKQLKQRFPGATASEVSSSKISNEIVSQVEVDLVRGESIGLPVALLLMLIVFGGFITAGLPLLGAVTAIGVGMGALLALTYAMDIDAFILNVISIIGLSLSIDYGLLVVSRFREEVAQRFTERGLTPGQKLPKGESRPLIRDAVKATVRTAGRTVSFSAITIAFAVAGLLVMSSTILRAIGVGAVIVVLLAVLSAITLVPAVLTLMGRFLLRPSPLSKVPGLRALFRTVGDSSSDEGFFSKLARWVHRRPWLIMVAVLAILSLMAYPVKDLSLRSNFAEYIPKHSSTYTAYHELQDHYPALATPSITVVADTTPDKTGDLVKRLKDIKNVTYVSQPTPAPDDANRTVINLRMDVSDQVGPEVVGAVKDLRAHDPGYPILVGGSAALQEDFAQSIVDDSPKALAIMIVAVLILLFLMTGSIVMPIKALIVNAFSLIASLGATDFVFRHGLLGMPKVAGIETFVFACAIAFGFGLAMDYEVFLLARIKEYWDSGMSNDEAVERGLQRSGRIITSAAAIIVAVFLGFTAGEMLAIKEIGIMLAITVVADATLVRMLLVPATMTILGKWNWYAPKPLRWVYDRFKIAH